MGTGLCKLEKEILGLLSVCKGLTSKSAERNEYGKTEMSTICLKGKISGSLLPSMNLRILSLSTE